MWILLGMMGAGKSSVGRALAEMSGRRFMDTDLLLQARFGRPITQIFQIYGEPTFREHETSILRSLQPEDVVLATGGGIVLREENWTELKRLGTTVYLRCTLDTLIHRLEHSKKKRPLLLSDDWQERTRSILSQRIPLYERADHIIEMDDGNIEAAAGRVLEQLLGSA
jgi:shikimate kinase